MDSIKTLNGNLIGYSLPSNIAALLKNIVRVQNFSGTVTLNLLPPIPELLNIKELIEIRNFGNKLIGFSLPPEIKQIQDVLVQLKTVLNIDDAASEDAFNSLLINIKHLEQIEDDQTHSFEDAIDSVWLAIYQNNRNLISVLMPIFIFLSGYAAERGLDYIFDDHQQEQMIEMIEQQREELKELKEQNNVILDEIKSLKSQISEDKNNKQKPEDVPLDII